MGGGVEWGITLRFHVGNDTHLEQSMTHHEFNVTTIADALEHLTEKGLEGMARAVEILLNEAMKPPVSG